VKRDHIKVTVEPSKEFRNCIVSVHKYNDSQCAMLMGYRYDTYNAPTAPKQKSSDEEESVLQVKVGSAPHLQYIA